MDTQKAVAIRIQQLCAEKGYNLHALARKAGIPPTTLKTSFMGTVGIRALLLLNYYATDWRYLCMIFSQLRNLGRWNPKTKNKIAGIINDLSIR